MNFIETWLINGFIALMLFLLWAWDLPERSLLHRLAFKLRWLMLRLGLFHSWRLFSPDPPTDNCRLQFRLRLADGSLVAIEPAYFRNAPSLHPLVQYRWLKLKRALLRTGAEPLRASMCKYIAAAYTVAAPPDKRPVEVQLIRWRQPIIPLADKATAGCAPYKCRILHTQPLDPLPAAIPVGRATKPLQLSFCPE